MSSLVGVDRLVKAVEGVGFLKGLAFGLLKELGISYDSLWIELDIWARRPGVVLCKHCVVTG